MKRNIKGKVVGSLAIIGLIVSLGGCAKEPAPYTVEHGIKEQCDFIMENWPFYFDVSAEYKRKLKPAPKKNAAEIKGYKERRTFQDRMDYWDYLYFGAEKYEYTLFYKENREDEEQKVWSDPVIVYFNPDKKEILYIGGSPGGGWYGLYK